MLPALKADPAIAWYFIEQQRIEMEIGQLGMLFLAESLLVTFAVRKYCRHR